MNSAELQKEGQYITVCVVDYNNNYATHIHVEGSYLLWLLVQAYQTQLKKQTVATHTTWTAYLQGILQNKQVMLDE